jgi:hypothetical protein
MTARISREPLKSARLLQFAGFGCLLVVVLTHVAEALHLLPGMGWGLPNSPGHYLDLSSAISGLALLPAGFVLRRIGGSSGVWLKREAKR